MSEIYIQKFLKSRWITFHSFAYIDEINHPDSVAENTPEPNIWNIYT